jgi:hypothetical protein
LHKGLKILGLRESAAAAAGERRSAKQQGAPVEGGRLARYLHDGLRRRVSRLKDGQAFLGKITLSGNSFDRSGSLTSTGFSYS